MKLVDCEICGLTNAVANKYRQKSYICKICINFRQRYHNNTINPTEVYDDYTITVLYNVFSTDHEGPCSEQHGGFRHEGPQERFEMSLPKLLTPQDFTPDGLLINKRKLFKLPTEPNQCICVKRYKFEFAWVSKDFLEVV